VEQVGLKQVEGRNLKRRNSNVDRSLQWYWISYRMRKILQTWKSRMASYVKDTQHTTATSWWIDLEACQFREAHSLKNEESHYGPRDRTASYMWMDRSASSVRAEESTWSNATTWDSKTWSGSSKRNSNRIKKYGTDGSVCSRMLWAKLMPR